MTKPRAARRRPVDLAPTPVLLIHVVGGSSRRYVNGNNGDDDQNAHVPVIAP